MRRARPPPYTNTVNVQYYMLHTTVIMVLGVSFFALYLLPNEIYLQRVCVHTFWSSQPTHERRLVKYFPQQISISRKVCVSFSPSRSLSRILSLPLASVTVSSAPKHSRHTLAAHVKAKQPWEISKHHTMMRSALLAEHQLHTTSTTRNEANFSERKSSFYLYTLFFCLAHRMAKAVCCHHHYPSCNVNEAPIVCTLAVTILLSLHAMEHHILYARG